MPGLLLITLVAIWAAAGSYFFDWNATHIFNPRWPPHAKFHNAHSMLLGTTVGLFSLLVLWTSKEVRRFALRLATISASLYWITQAGAILFPGTALVDPEFRHAGQLPAQLIVDVIMLLLLTIAYPLEAKRIKQVIGKR